LAPITLPPRRLTFSILERIDVGETQKELREFIPLLTFSILERIDVGETMVCLLQLLMRSCLSVSSNGSTWVKRLLDRPNRYQSFSFSILERIDVGETNLLRQKPIQGEDLSVSSNGSTWVKRLS